MWKKAEHKEMLQKKKTCTLEIHANMKCQLQLKNQYDQINSECDNISVKRKQVEQKIRIDSMKNLNYSHN